MRRLEMPENSIVFNSAAAHPNRLFREGTCAPAAATIAIRLESGSNPPPRGGTQVSVLNRQQKQIGVSNS